jgi:uncharacterized protein HemX
MEIARIPPISAALVQETAGRLAKYQTQPVLDSYISSVRSRFFEAHTVSPSPPTAEQQRMSRPMETLSTVNSFLRTILSFVVVGALGVGSWFGYNVYNENEITQATLLKKDAELAEATADLKSKEEELVTKRQMIADQDVAISDLNDDVRQKQQQIERLNTAIALLKVDHRLAMITVLDQITDPETGVARTSIAFTEVNEQGE